ncbi:MAG: ChuX/HutX family heme-like substrate-binding protein [Litoreibacter sp.]
MVDLTPNEIRELRSQNLQMRERDFAETNQISEAQLLGAYTGQSVTRIDAHPDAIMAAAMKLGEVMALTRNPSCVHEKIGVYENYHPGTHAAMILTEDIDLRIFPSHWVHGFLVEKETDKGVMRSLQVFDAAGDAIHKIFLRDGSDLAQWDVIKETLKIEDQSQEISVEPRKTSERPKSDTSKLEILRKEWARMTDTHQFMRLTSKLKMNRLGAYRIVGEPFVRALSTGAVDEMLTAVRDTGTEVMVFTGNRGCIQIHSGPIKSLTPMGPWQNVMDPNFNLHLRADHVAEVWAVNKPTQRGDAVSVEAFDKEGVLIFQIFGLGKEGRDNRPAWRGIVDKLTGLDAEAVA